MSPDVRARARRAFAAASGAGRAVRALGRRARVVGATVATRRRRPAVREAAAALKTEVDRYWNRHLVRSEPFASARESAEYLEWRFDEYPRYRELMGLWGDHTGEVVLDYGCGPGDDLVGLLLYSGARRVVGVDVSLSALELARRRVALHGIDVARVELVHVADARPEVPLPDGSVDFVHCSGVLHHTTAPREILRELERVLRNSGRGRVMVYNRCSVWFHLYVAYVLMVLGGDQAPIDDVFRRSTDGPECPVSTAYHPDDFCALLRDFGFDASFAGGYAARQELDVLLRHADAARDDERLGSEHRTFLRRLSRARDGVPEIDGLGAGIGGVYRLRKS